MITRRSRDSFRRRLKRKGPGCWNISGDRETALPDHVAVRRPTIIPNLDLLAEIDNPNLISESKGLEQRNGRSEHHIALRLPDAAQHRAFGRKLDEAVDVYLDASTFLVARTERFLRTAEGMDLMVPSSVEFSDYRRVGPLYIPFRIVNTTGDRRMGMHQTTMVLSNADVNAAVPDALFALRGGRQ